MNEKGCQSKKTLFIKDGLYKTPEGSGNQYAMVASRCPACKEIFFPKRFLCQNCQHRVLDEILLSTKGTVFSFTAIMQQPGHYYRGPVPYTFGWVELPEGVRIETLFTNCDGKSLEIGQEVEMIMKEVCQDNDGNSIICHMFSPIQKD